MENGERAEPVRRFVAPGVRPGAVLTVALAVALTGYVIVYPLTLVRYPPMVDLPFHAAQTAILAHHTDPAWHFQEQFTLHPFAVPYLSMYAAGAGLAWLLPIHLAAKGMAMLMLALLPVGLGVLCWGLKKSPALGLIAGALVWNTLTHWGFLNFLGALGLMAAAVGLALRIVDRPTRSAQVALAATLVALFFTHVYRVPFAILGVLAAGAVLYPVTCRFRPLLVPLLPVTCLFVGWALSQAAPLPDAGLALTFDVSRVVDLPRHVFGAYTPPDGAPPTDLSVRERWLSGQVLASLAALAVLCGIARRREGRTEAGDPATLWRRAAGPVPLLLGAGMLLAYVMLPYEMGNWFYVYPREAVSACYFLLAALPDLPRRTGARLGALGLVALAAVPTAQLVATEYRRFERLTADFREIVAEIPRAPRLFYLLYDLGGTSRRASPLLHLPAWIQAERGGWLNFHFVRWRHSPIRYRASGPAIPPALPGRFEWTPQHFRVREHGAWFDTFLIRHSVDPSELFTPDPSIQLVSRRGTWWLYRRHNEG
jgi:hypothetical protein